MGIVSARWCAIRDTFSASAAPRKSDMLPVLELLGIGAAVLDARGELVSNNLQLSKILGLIKITGRQLHELIATAIPDPAHPVSELCSHFHIEHADVFGGTLPLQLKLVALSNGEFLLTLQGKEFSPALSEEHREAQRLREEFISIVSHEIRTPLASMHGGLGLLASGRVGALPATAQRMLNIANESSQRLVRLVNDLLDINKLESGQMRFSIQAVNAREAMQLAIDAMRQQAEAACVHLQMGGDGAIVLCDHDRLLQVLTNLLSNAVKFSPIRGEVRLSCKLRDTYAVFIVEDRGRGIPQEKLPHVFDKFSQVDVADATRKGGTGLGLAICRQIVERQQGRIWAESKPGEGTAFYFSLPLAVQACVINGERRNVLHLDGTRG
jgi:signal transduction histidine kinase